MQPEAASDTTLIRAPGGATSCIAVPPFLREPPSVAELELLRAERALLGDLLAARPQALARYIGSVLGEVAPLHALVARRTRELPEFQRKLRILHRRCARIAARARRVPLPRLADDFDRAANAFGLLAANPQASGDEFLPAQALLEAALMTVSLVAARTGAQAPTRRRARRTQLTRPRVSPATRNDLPAPQLGLALHQLAERVAHETGKRIELALLGLEHVPADMTGAVFDICSQLLRNAVQHGVETPALRSESGKPAAGAVLIEFRRQGRAQCELCVQDDGQGLQVEQLMEAGMVQSERGRGMGIVGERIKALKGQLQVSTRRGQFTRIRIRMPLPDEPVASQVRSA
jgi:signal transduction histidine kinase